MDILPLIFNAFIPAGLQVYAEIALSGLAIKELWDIWAGAKKK